MITDDLLHILPFVSAALWLAVAAIPFVRYHFGSPFRGILAASFLLLGVWALLDGVFLNLPGEASYEGAAVGLSNVRITVMTFATLALLLAAKWLDFGHSRYDALLAAPAAGALGLVWVGMTRGATLAPWGWKLNRDPTLYTLWASQQVAYVAAALVIVVALYFSRRDLAPRLRRRFFWSAGSLFAFLAIWISTNMYNNVTQTAGVPWFSSLLMIPATIIIVAFAPLSADDLGELFRGVSAVAQRVSALYVFYKSGEPLVAVGSSRNLPIEAEPLEGVLNVVGDFVETSMQEYRGYAVTSMHFDPLSILAVRAQYVIVAAIYDGPAYDTLRGELLRSVRAFEERRGQELQTWEGATRIAEEIADDLSKLMAHAPPPSRPPPSPPRSGPAVPPVDGPSRNGR